MKAIIIDDEVKAQENLGQLLKLFCPQINVIAVADNINKGEELLRKHQDVDLLFLDIEMPNGNGFELLKRFDSYTFKVILITAYDQYAIQAIKAQAFDYLLKPIEIDELVEAVSRIAESESSRSDNFTELKTDASREKLALPMKDGYVFLSFSDILRIESDGSYTTFYTQNSERHVVSKHMKEFERLLPADRFFRCHKSHIINLDCVKKFVRNDGFSVELNDGTLVEVSRRKKDEFLDCMQH